MPEFFVWLSLLGVFDAPINCDQCESWNRPQEPFNVFGNTWYVGTGGLGAILLATDDGLALFDGGLPQSAERIVANIASLGFDVADIRFIGLSHAHYDHAGGIAAIQRLSGADVFAGQDAAIALRAGALQPTDPQFADRMTGQTFPPVADARGVDDGWQFEMGNTTITAIATPGHTVGGMSWSWRTCENDRCLTVVYVDSLTPVSRSGYRYADGLASALEDTLRRLGKIECDILLSTHDFSFDLHDKLAAGKAAFVDPDACHDLAGETSTYLEKRLKSERP
jgi:metallo-beta-lactamase class B